jgi:hypothetical protein
MTRGFWKSFLPRLNVGRYLSVRDHSGTTQFLRCYLRKKAEEVFLCTGRPDQHQQQE